MCVCIINTWLDGVIGLFSGDACHFYSRSCTGIDIHIFDMPPPLDVSMYLCFDVSPRSRSRSPSYTCPTANLIKIRFPISLC